MPPGPIAEDEAGISLGPSRLTPASQLPAALVGDSPQLRAVLDQVAEVAGTTSPVLLIGERDTGKRELARMIHQMSPHADAPLITIDCGGQRAELQRVLLDEADPSPADATLVLGELETLEAELQARVIEALIKRAGARAAGPGLRLIVVIDSDLELNPAAHGLASKLEAALGAVLISMPALRERRTDVPVLADYFVAAANRKFGRHVSAHPLLAALDTYSWPGNLKELETRVASYVTGAPPEAEPAHPNAFAVPIDRLDVTLLLPDGTRHDVRLPRGPGRPLEELFEDKEPFIAVQQAGKTRIYARAALACIVAADPIPLEDEALPQRRRAVRVVLRGGVTLEGELRYVPVEGRGRVTDVLNEHSPCIALHRDNQVQLIAKSHVLCVEEC